MPDSWALRKLQFLALYRVFLFRVVDLDLLSTDGDPTRLIGQFATIFTTISFFFSLLAILILMGGDTMPMADGWMFEHFFIETTMTVAGLIAVLNWDAAFPDRRDVLVLAPLPVRTSTLFAAKIAALFAAPALATIALNVFSGVLWPVIFRSSQHGFAGVLRSWPAYWITIFAAGAFVVFGILAIQGLAAHLLPLQLFLRLSAVLQAAIMCLLLSVYFLEPSLESPEALTSPQNQRLLTCLPSYWFLALFNQLNGSMHPALAPLAREAWIGLAASSAGACAALLLCYFRMMRKLVEQPDILPAPRSMAWSPQLGDQLTNAITYFGLRTLLRSRQHRMILSFFVGIGITCVVGYVKVILGGFGGASSFLLASIALMILAVVALRAVSSIPISLRANWIIRITQIRPVGDYQRAVRFSWMALGVGPLLLAVATFFFATHPWRPALGHLMTMMCLGILLVELCLYSFPKLPFTCSYLPGKAQVHFVFWACVLLFVRLLDKASRLEDRMLGHVLGCGAMVLIVAAAAAGMRWLNGSRVALKEDLMFEEEYDAEITSLRLS
jgi:hypothetical protein